MRIRHILSNIGWDGALLGTCGAIAFFTGVIDSLPQFQYTQDPILRMVISFIGLLMGAVAVQNARRRAEISELKQELTSALGIAESKLLNSDKEFAEHLVPRVLQAKHFVWDTVMNRAWPSEFTPYFSGTQVEYKRLLYERVSKGEIGFRRVEVILHPKGLEQLLQRLLIHEKYSFYIRHYEPPPSAIPIVNLMSFDGESFYLGGFHTKASPGEEPLLYIRDPNFAKLYRNYWNALWSGAIPLNEGKVINWDELKRIALNLHMTESEFEAMRIKVSEEAQREKRQLRLK